jgi:hypothetical protein
MVASAAETVCMQLVLQYLFLQLQQQRITSEFAVAVHLECL